MRLLSFLILSLQIISFPVFSSTSFSDSESYQASIRDQEVIYFMEELGSISETNLSFYSTQYFSNLKKNSPVNSHGSCSFTALTMLLSFYDSYWNDNFIAEDYDQASLVNASDTAYGLNSNTESPGVKTPAIENVTNLSNSDYELYISSSKGTDFQSYLIDLAYGLFGSDSFSNDSPYGLTFYQQTNLLYRYLVYERGITTNVFTMDNLNDYNTQEEFQTFLHDKIELGIPVLINVESSVYGKHTVIAYDYDEDDIYVHTGWKSTNDLAFSHTSLYELSVTKIDSAISLLMVNDFCNPKNYKDQGSNQTYGVNCFAYAHDFQSPSQVSKDIAPTFNWKSLYNEQWFNEGSISFKIRFSINGTLYPLGGFIYSTTPSITLTIMQWREILRLSYSSSAEILITCYDSKNANYSLEAYTSSFTFPCLSLNPTVHQVVATDFGFSNTYPTDTETKSTFITHTKNDFTFKTRRYRTGYTHDNSIVLSPMISEEIEPAFLEFQFYKGVTSIDVDMSFYRYPNYEGLNSNNGVLRIEYLKERNYHTTIDFFKDNILLPTDINNKKTITINFAEEVFRVRFYASIKRTTNNNYNMDRVCLDNFTFHETQRSETILPLNGYELKYEPELWNNSEMRQLRTCYTYALNFFASYEHVSNYIFTTNPGEFSSDEYDETSLSYFTPQNIEKMVLSDSASGVFNGENFIFKPIEKGEICDDYCYKVALIFDLDANNPDYHWYRQNSDGTWSHKLGRDYVINCDGNYNDIFDPSDLSCCHDYRNFSGHNYNSHYGVTFYQVSPTWLYKL